MHTIGQKLRELREKENLLLRQVAAALELDTALLSKFERDERKPSKEQVIAFAKYYKVQPDEMMVALLSDKVISDIAEEDLASQVLKVAESKLEFLKREKKTSKKK